MSKKDEEIVSLKNEVETLKARISNLEVENKQLRLRAKGSEQRLKKVQKTSKAALSANEKENDILKNRVITIGKQAERVLDAKNKEIENLGGLVRERAFAIKSSQPLDIRSHTVIHGAILSDDSVMLGDNVLVDGHIDSGGMVSIGAQSTVKGVIRAKGDVDIGLESEIQGDVESEGSVTLEAETRVSSIKATGSVDLGERCVADRVTAEGDVVLGNNATIELGIRYGGSVSIGKHTSVKGTIEFFEDDEDDDSLFEGLTKGAPAKKKQSKPLESEDDDVHEEESKDAGLTCPVCGTPIPPGSKRCKGCGTLVRGITGSVDKTKEKDVHVPHTVERRKVKRKK
ncbi:MAG: hypothetical protein KAT70_05630 [Thermoplasmata archaeon]|nr:hypothetical protein [Thermoplasmata archaeon]